MEKLQAALEQARAKRGNLGVLPSEVSPSSQTGTETRHSRTSSLDARWAAIEAVHLDAAKLRKHRVVAENRSSPDAASFDVMRTKVLLQMEKNGWKSVAVTSSRSSAGKSTVCCNLASAIARQKSIRAILMDIDMRRPSLASILGLQPIGTVADVLTGQMLFADHARRLGPNVALSLNSGPVKDPSDVFLNPRTAEIVSQIERDYQPDLMIFDVPPMFVNDDAAAFFSNVDCVLIVADAGRTTVSELDRCEKEVAEHANVLGVILNKCDFSEDSYGYGYSASY